MPCFQKPYWPYFLGAYSKFGFDIWLFSSILVYFEWFPGFSYVKKIFFAYLPTLKSIEMFLERRHLFFLA